MASPTDDLLLDAVPRRETSPLTGSIFKSHAEWWQNDPVNFHTVKARYNAAFDAYQQVLKRNSDRTVGGEKPDVSDIEHEKNALRLLEEARCALWAALAPNRSAD